MMKNILLLLLIFLSTSFTHDDIEDKISWTKEYKLTWSDFKGKPNKSSKNFAATDSGFGFKTGTITKDSCTIIVENNFFKKSSWVKKDKGSNKLLAHEQCHFDITEVCTRKARKTLSLVKFDFKTIQKTLDEIFKNEHSDWIKMQTLYDKETEHSIAIEKQQEWEKKVAKKLNELKNYSELTIRILKQ